MRLSSKQRDRAGGVLLGQAIGDALGVPYEFRPRIAPGEAQMVGGGRGPYAPGEWSDDTQMAVCIAQATASDGYAGEETLRVIARRFVDWRNDGASDIGVQTATALSRAQGSGDVLTALQKASQQAADADRAGNGALMRTAVVGLVALDDRLRTAEAASAIAALTHAHPLCVESAVLWSEAVRVAVVEGRLDVRAGLDLLVADRRPLWETYLDEAENEPPGSFVRNGFTVTALQAAWAAIQATRYLDGPDHVEAALQAAVAIGHDTDTVAAIAGGLLGARYGVSGLPSDLARRVNGWPGLRGRDLVGLALAIATGGRDAWHSGASMLDGRGRPLAVPHPDDPEVLLGTEADLARCAELGVTAVVSLSRVGAPEIAAAGVKPGRHAEVWLVDSDDPDLNAHLAWTLADAARTVAALRADGERVLLHCVAADHRTPAAALAYSHLLGTAVGAAARIEDAIGHRVGGLLWQTAAQTAGGRYRSSDR